MTPGRFVGVLATIVGLGLTLPGLGLPRATPAAPLVAIQYGSDSASLVRVDATSLERVDGAAVPLDYGSGAWTLSPDGATAAFGNNDAMALTFYDLARMKLKSALHLGLRPGSVDVLAWPAANRLLALVQVSCCSFPSVVSVDPETGVVIGRSPLPGEIRDWAPTGDGAVVLIGRQNRIGPARLAVVNADGGVRWVTVARLRVGFKPKPSVVNGKVVEPGLAVDSAGGRIFLIPAGGPAAEIRVADLAVAYHAIRSGTRRLAAAQKEFRGPWRSARYVGDGIIAVSGYNGVRRGKHFAFVPAGLRLVDTRDWSERTLDRTSTSFTFTSPLVVAVHASDLVAFSTQGQVRFQVPIGQQLGITAAIGGYVYVWQPDNRVVVVDLEAGRVVNTTAPTSVMPIALAPA